MPQYEVWSDASWQPTNGTNKGPAGMAAIIITPSSTRKIIIARDTSSTNCRAELIAALLGVQEIPISSEFILYTDSMYVIRCIKGARIIINLDIAVAFRKLLATRMCLPVFVKSHSGNTMNNLADHYAKIAVTKGKLIPEEFRLPDYH